MEFSASDTPSIRDLDSRVGVLEATVTDCLGQLVEGSSLRTSLLETVVETTKKVNENDAKAMFLADALNKKAAGLTGAVEKLNATTTERLAELKEESAAVKEKVLAIEKEAEKWKKTVAEFDSPDLSEKNFKSEEARKKKGEKKLERKRLKKIERAVDEIIFDLKVQRTDINEIKEMLKTLMGEKKI
jgi:hypothetical protein